MRDRSSPVSWLASTTGAASLSWLDVITGGGDSSALHDKEDDVCFNKWTRQTTRQIVCLHVPVMFPKREIVNTFIYKKE